ncbi:MAG: MBL fold metallo-hydrolase [Thermoplasmatota archaeon]
MADPALRHPDNVQGDLFVDTTCIDCATCRWMAPETFGRQAGQSVVEAQPPGGPQRQEALRALLSCPTGSIGLATPDAKGLKDAAADLPAPITNGVYHTGYHARSSFGAAAYFVQRPEGNLLVDSPRYNRGLAQRLAAMGGVDLVLLTHRDDVADHEKWHDHFGCERLLHADDVTSGTRGVEIQPEGQDVLELAGGLRAIPVPGHTKGHMVFLHDDVLFTGDHLAWSLEREHLVAFRRACWYDWVVQRESMKRLLDERFEWVLPGHGRRAHLQADPMQESLRRCIDWMARVG